MGGMIGYDQPHDAVALPVIRRSWPPPVIGCGPPGREVRPMTKHPNSEPQPHTEDGEIVEPPNSTVDDWLGQQVNEDAELVDQLLQETGGDAEEAERRFRSHEDRPDRLPTDQRRR
jgi:hypothetical protein